MQYMLLIHQPELKLSPEEQGKFYQEYGAFTEGIRKNGNFKNGDPLDAPATATTVKVRNGKTLLTDGPFAETKEQISGYYIIEAKNLDEAAAIASRIPSARFGGIEVRPIRTM